MLDKKGSISLTALAIIVAFLAVGGVISYVAVDNYLHSQNDGGNNNDKPSDMTNEYCLMYDPNSGSGSVITERYDAEKTVTINANVHSKEGYEFKEWNTKSDGSGTTYQIGDHITINSSMTLYAVWEKENDNSLPEEKNGIPDVLYNYKIVKTINDSTYRNYDGYNDTDTPISGSKFVVVDIVVKNKSYPYRFIPQEHKFKITCADGKAYARDYFSTKNYSSTTDNLNRRLDIGSSVTFTAVYKIPSGTSAMGLTWYIPGSINPEVGRNPLLEFKTQDGGSTSPEDNYRRSPDVQYNYKIVKTIDSFTYKGSDGSDCIEMPTNGYKFVVVDIVIKNNSCLYGYLPYISEFDLKCDDGRVYGCARLSTNHYSSTIDNMSKLAIDSPTTFTMVFEIQTGTSAIGFKLGGSIIGCVIALDPSIAV